ncbi:hypothetical protein J6590_096405 [Homalodisca vitripennis]|nr:hypothetical protein J6590_096405 [Homalodisca vitripennis]
MRNARGNHEAVNQRRNCRTNGANDPTYLKCNYKLTTSEGEEISRNKPPDGKHYAVNNDLTISSAKLSKLLLIQDKITIGWKFSNFCCSQTLEKGTPLTSQVPKVSSLHATQSQIIEEEQIECDDQKYIKAQETRRRKLKTNSRSVVSDINTTDQELCMRIIASEDGRVHLQATIKLPPPHRRIEIDLSKHYDVIEAAKDRFSQNINVERKSFEFRRKLILAGIKLLSKAFGCSISLLVLYLGTYVLKQSGPSPQQPLVASPDGFTATGSALVTTLKYLGYLPPSPPGLLPTRNNLQSSNLTR